MYYKENMSVKNQLYILYVGMELKKHKSKNSKDTNLIQKDGGEERQEEYCTSVPLLSSVWNRCRVLFLSLFPTIFLH